MRTAFKVVFAIALVLGLVSTVAANAPLVTAPQVLNQQTDLRLGQAGGPFILTQAYLYTPQPRRGKLAGFSLPRGVRRTWSRPHGRMAEDEIRIFERRWRMPRHSGQRMVANIAERWMRSCYQVARVFAACVSAVGIFRDAAFIAAVQARPLAPAVAGSIGAVTAAPAGDAANGVLREGGEAGGQEAEAEEGGERASARERFMIRLLCSDEIFRGPRRRRAPRYPADTCHRRTASSSAH